MSTIKSSDEHLTINADGSGKEVKIQRDGTEVLATTNTGIDITGSVTADGLTVADANGDVILDSGTGEAHSITLSHKGSYAEINAIEFAQASTTYGNNQIKFLNMNSAGNVVETMRITGSGNVEVNTGNLVIGTSGKGIDFSATADGSGTSTSEVLDDYEEGTWTPAVVGGTLTIDSIESANYVKIGKFVHIECYIRTDTADGDTTQMKLSGLPYAAQNYGTGTSINKGNTGGTELDNPHFRFAPNSTTFSFFRNFKQANLNQNDIHGDHIIFSGTYSTTS